MTTQNALNFSTLSNNPDLNTLRLFVAVVQAGSFSKASEQIGTPIPTLSRRIGELEQQLGVLLFDRTKAGVKATATGQQLYEQVRLPIDSLLQVQYGLDNEQLNGRLRISMVNGNEPVWAWLAEFQRLYPNIKLHCQATDRVVDLTQDGIDVAFRVGQLHTDNVVAFPVLTSCAKLIATPEFLQQHGTPHTADELKNYPLISWARVGEPLLQGVFADNETVLPLYFSSSDHAALEYMTLSHHGIACLSNHSAERLIQSGQAVEVLADIPKRGYTLHALYLPHRHQSAVIKTFVQFLKQKAQAV
ncbi:DNA-binding transcriptional regulator, LysR family [Pasteurella testudinis DSM 23072]|uniref:DNA-binding transcriptional regulator, LysR family n=1 Tax=Pasteurella testudinis DSM 23072 TaxID=1122938 RepID=A0A1W1UL78_9PAST|nr:LysR family transcriptional regulator [Pasteurella testudinis]SMB81827.1 DNA-binding transcriptional regulator, LysR family [Pasteurella testudinis DSM 23072]SUB50301.1 glycine cleavage system transcriptional activator [Pasteurella testudinis]